MFRVIRPEFDINPSAVRAEHAKGVLRITISKDKGKGKSARMSA